MKALQLSIKTNKLNAANTQQSLPGFGNIDKKQDMSVACKPCKANTGSSSFFVTNIKKNLKKHAGKKDDMIYVFGIKHRTTCENSHKTAIGPVLALTMRLWTRDS